MARRSIIFNEVPKEDAPQGTLFEYTLEMAKIRVRKKKLDKGPGLALKRETQMKT